MNYKLVFPTFRSRYRYVGLQLQQLTSSVEKAINVGCGEGDYDFMIAQHAKEVVSCDINQSDLDFAREFNSDVSNLNYQIQDAQNLTYEDNSFQLLVCLEVIEHVEDSTQMVKEWARVLESGGTAIITFPSIRFPFTYDPINRLLHPFGKHIPVGAYGYSHFKLIDPDRFEKVVKEAGFEIVDRTPLTSYFTAIFELYYPSIIQAWLKPNSGNAEGGKEKRMKMRPSRKDSILGKITGVLMAIDRALFGWSNSSVNVAYVLRKR